MARIGRHKARGRLALACGVAVVTTLVGAASAEADWFAPVSVSDANTTSSAPAIGLDSDGNATAMWVSGASGDQTVNFASRDAGGDWSLPLDPGAPTGGVFASDLAVGADGAAVAAWFVQGAANGVVYAATRPAGSSRWGTPTMISVNPTGSLDVAINANGDAAVGFTVTSGSTSIALDVATFDGASWSMPQQVGSAAVNIHGSVVALDAAGNPTVMWEAAGGGSSDQVEASSRDTSGTWAEPTTLGTSDGFNDPLRLVVNGAGDMAAAWADNAPSLGGDNHLMVATRPSGAAWGTADTVATSTSQLQGDIAIDGQGKATAIWAVSSETAVVVASKSQTSDGGWPEEATPLSADDGVANAPRLAADEQGDVVAVWCDFNGNKAFVAEQPAGAGWGSPTVISATAVARSPSVALDADGDAAVAYQNQVFPSLIEVAGSGAPFAPAAPAVSLSATSLDFGDVTTSTTSTSQTVTLTNSGNASLVMGDLPRRIGGSGAAHTAGDGVDPGVSLEGDNSADFAVADDTCSTMVIPAGGTCTVTVSFTPSAVGERGAALQFTDDADDSPQTVALIGVGVAPPDNGGDGDGSTPPDDGGSDQTPPDNGGGAQTPPVDDGGTQTPPPADSGTPSGGSTPTQPIDAPAPPAAQPAAGDDAGGAVLAPSARGKAPVTSSGTVTLPLSCPTGQTCSVSGTLTFSTSAFASKAARASAAATTTLARFSGISVSGGKVRSLRLHLPKSFVRAAQKAGKRTVRATLTIHTKLGSGKTITKRQQVTLTIPRARAAKARKPAPKPTAIRPSFTG